jgi:asparagine synthase (glutamine-hydrolysing)
LAAELDRLERSQLASRLLDLPKLKKVMEAWPKEREAGGPVSPRYRAMLLRSLHAGQFLRWVEGGNG